MLTEAKTTLTMLTAALVAGAAMALTAFALLSGPAVGEETAAAPHSPNPCHDATWPDIPPECLSWSVEAGEKHRRVVRPNARIDLSDGSRVSLTPAVQTVAAAQ